jgi:hypothetical protein
MQRQFRLAADFGTKFSDHTVSHYGTLFARSTECCETHHRATSSTTVIRTSRESRPCMVSPVSVIDFLLAAFSKPATAPRANLCQIACEISLGWSDDAIIMRSLLARSLPVASPFLRITFRGHDLRSSLACAREKGPFERHRQRLLLPACCFPLPPPARFQLSKGRSVASYEEASTSLVSACMPPKRRTKHCLISVFQLPIRSRLEGDVQRERIEAMCGEGEGREAASSVHASRQSA